VIGGAALLLGLVLPLVAAGGLTESRLAPQWMLVTIVGVAAGWHLGAAVRQPTLFLLVAVAAAGFLMRLMV
jgi:hypothetical protein